MEQKFKPHLRPNCSKLEKWRKEIAKMRSLNWPYQKIIDWLQHKEGYKAGRETLRQFCIVRGIRKGQQHRRSLQNASNPQSKPQQPIAKKFTYKDNVPIRRFD